MVSAVTVALPLRFLAFASLLHLLPEQFLTKHTKEYDNGRFSQYIELYKVGDAVSLWSANLALEKSIRLVNKARSSVTKQWSVKKIVYLVSGLVLVGLIFKKPLSESSSELLSGNMSSSRPIIDLPDTLFVQWNKPLEYSEFQSEGYEISDVPSIVQASIHSNWSLSGRFIKDVFIKCDTLVELNDWSATVFPPSYSGLEKYICTDTIKAFEGSKVELKLAGRFTDLLKENVSRETLDNLDGLLIRDTSKIVLVYYQQRFELPVLLIEDNAPRIEILSNTFEKIDFKVTDDYKVAQIKIDGQRHDLVETFQIVWNDASELVLYAKDNKGQVTVRTISRPNPSLSTIKNQLNSSLSSPLKLFKEFTSTLKDSAKGREEESQKTEKDKDRRKRTTKEKQNQEEEEPDSFNKELEELWNIEMLIDALEMVTEEKDASLDSAIVDLVEDLENTDKPELQEVLKQVKSLDEQGKDRKEEAKDSAEKLKEVLVESTVEVQADNIERIKRLLKKSWKASIKQELTTILSSGQSIRLQRQLLTIQNEIEDSLDFIIVSDPMLGMVLNATRENVNAAVDDMSASLSKNIPTEVQAHYLVNALNELNMRLYELLEAEKKALSQAQKQCKKGKPGKKGKPKNGKAGQKPSPKNGSKPGERNKGKVGKPRDEGESKQPGEGRSDQELLKRIDELLGTKPGEGVGKDERELLEKLKRELLFNRRDGDEQLDDFENRLWESLESIFTKEEQGNDRKAEEGVDVQGKEGIEIIEQPLKNGRSDLPLPVLRKK